MSIKCSRPKMNYNNIFFPFSVHTICEAKYRHHQWVHWRIPAWSGILGSKEREESVVLVCHENLQGKVEVFAGWFSGLMRINNQNKVVAIVFCLFFFAKTSHPFVY